jgi:Fe-S-cluster-containing dehydrogenase component
MSDQRPDGRTDEQRARDEQLWERRARAVLAQTVHDTDLGVDIARDAQRVIAGELTEEEFTARYHQAYVDHFGVDARPKLSEGLVRRYDDDPEAEDLQPAVVDRPAGAEPTGHQLDGSAAVGSVPDGTDEVPRLTRRQLLGRIGGAAGAAAVGGFFLSDMFRVGAADALGNHQPAAAGVGPAAAAPDTPRVGSTGQPVQYGMVIDLETCDGCLACVSACSDSNGLSDGVLWAYVFSYAEPEESDPRFLVRLCQHCTNAPCVMVCPTSGRHRRLSDGLVLTDYDVCIGCRYCMVSCPYGVNYFQWGDPASYGGSYAGERHDSRGKAVAGDAPKGVMSKCTFCPIRQDDPDRRGSTTCADACSMNAIHFGDLNDPESEPNQYLASRRAEAPGGQLPTFRLLDDLGTQPNIIYIGHPPSRHAEIVDGPFSYEDWGLTTDRRKVLEMPTNWFNRAAEGAAV